MSGSSGSSGSLDVGPMLERATTVCAAIVTDCVRPFTDKTGGDEWSSYEFGGVIFEGVCCEAKGAKCCEWTGGGIALLIFLIILFLVSVAGCMYCCCGIGNPRGGCCNRGPAKHMTTSLL